ncbi:MAG: hypothetical protein JSW14_05600 [Candidatus Bathyarchaeum sp.]|nr:MAG: hypothetical protein JSW14_05600 [Candidatus Bathyarchaeum sp.]
MTKLWEASRQEGEMLLGTPQRQNRVDAQAFKFCASAHGNSRFCEPLPLLVNQRKTLVV